MKVTANPVRNGAVCAIVLACSNAPALELNLYGLGNLSLDNVDDGQDSDWYLASNSSRLGIRGNHAIGENMIVFQFEQGVDLTGDGGNDGNGSPEDSDVSLFTKARDSYLGAQGPWGRVVAGRLPGLNQWIYDYNLFADQVGDLGNVWGGTGLPGRMDSTVQYATPDISGFEGAFTYSPEDGKDDTDNFVVKLNYRVESNPQSGGRGLKLGGAYGSFGQGKDLNEHKAWAVTASYDFGRFNVGGGWQSESDIGGISGADRDSWTLGAATTLLGRHTLKAQYANSDEIDGRPKSDANQIALGYDFAWDKHTTLYATYAYTDNKASGSFTCNNYGHGDTVSLLPGDNCSTISFGVVYKFDLGLWPR